MICKFRILSDEHADFARELIVESDQTFLEFHNCIQENLGFDPMQLASFYLTNNAWEKSLQITLMDMMDEEGDHKLIMEDTKVGEHLKEVGQRMLYVFDFFSERSFFIELTEILKVSTSTSLPKVVYEAGDPPAQIDLGLDLPMGDDPLGDDPLADILGEDPDLGMGSDMEYLDGDDFIDE